jgi:hypothetical protein
MAASVTAAGVGCVAQGMGARLGMICAGVVDVQGLPAGKARLCCTRLTPLLLRCREGLDGPSRADEVDDWGKSKQFVPSGSRGFDDRSRGGFDDRPRGGFRERSPGFREPSRADTEDRWSK